MTQPISKFEQKLMFDGTVKLGAMNNRKEISESNDSEQRNGKHKIDE
jgi:hypothetical protein